jgi:acetate kinase
LRGRGAAGQRQKADNRFARGVTGMYTILVANAGSSSVKFQLFEVGQRGDLKRLIKGQIDGIGTRPRLLATAADGTVLKDRTYPPEDVPDVSIALHKAGAWLREEQQVSPEAIGHRVVHGGPDYTGPVMINEEVLARLERYIPLAPLHQPYNLAPIRSISTHSPQLPQVACFDTAFHRGHGPLADHYAIPRILYDQGVRRYGFHGLSYEYISGKLQEISPEIAAGKVIVAHLGSGASMCALENGNSVESTLGFTALDGLPMGTRCGQIDPGVVLFLIAEKHMSPATVQDLLYRDCGLKGLSGISSDMRELEASDDPHAAFAIDYFVYRIGLSAGMLAAALGGLNAFVFTAGIGENSALVRARVSARLAWLGATLDPAANKANSLLISGPGSRFPIYVVPTDEELMIAQHTLALISTSRGSCTSHWVTKPASFRRALGDSARQVDEAFEALKKSEEETLPLQPSQSAAANPRAEQRR